MGMGEGWGAGWMELERGRWEDIQSQGPGYTLPRRIPSAKGSQPHSPLLPHSYHRALSLNQIPLWFVLQP